MNDSSFNIEKAKEWFIKADHDLQAAKIIFSDPEPPTDTVCFHCQQAVEKYLKGFLTFHKIDFIKSHDLDYLLKISKNILVDIQDYEEEILSLNKYSIDPRYPADIPIYYGLSEAKQAFEKAKTVIGFIKSKITS